MRPPHRLAPKKRRSPLFRGSIGDVNFTILEKLVSKMTDYFFAAVTIVVLLQALIIVLKKPSRFSGPSSIISGLLPLV